VAVSVSTYLDRIVPDVRRRLEQRKAALPEAALARMAGGGLRPSFAAALGGSGVSLVAEVKRLSPSKGPIRPELDVGWLVDRYEQAGAAAISVLTEEDHFGGSLRDLRQAAAGTSLPLLRKDFVVDPYQVYEARVFGASAVLLIASLLDEEALHRLSGLAFDLGMDVLLEVHDAEEMARALGVRGAVVGINNRDLRTFAVELETSASLAAVAPPGTLLVAESGIGVRADVERLAACGVDAVLVGESLLRAPDPGAAAHALVCPPVAVGRRAGAKKGQEEREEEGS
jgi:indole-3-glycerol phosphate synthase